MDKNEKIMLGIGVLGISAITIYALRKKPIVIDDTKNNDGNTNDNTKLSLNVSLLSDDNILLTDIVFSIADFKNQGVLDNNIVDNWFLQFLDGDLVKQKCIRESSILSTKNPYRGRWIYFDGYKWEYNSTNNT